MKKINLKYLICLISSSVLLYAFLSVCYFYGISLNGIIPTFCFPAIYALVFLGIFKWITEKDFKSIIDVELIDNEEENKLKIKKINRKKYKYFWIIFLVHTLIFVGVSLGEKMIANDTFSVMEKQLTEMASISVPPDELAQYVEENMNRDYYSKMENYNKEWLTSKIYSCLIFILVYVIFYLFFIKQKVSKSKILKIIYRIVEIILVIAALLVGIYYFVDIPEFKYRYEFLEDGISVDSYADFIRAGHVSLVVPEKIWGKPVVELGGNWMLYDEIILPSTFPLNQQAITSFSSFTNIHMSGDAIDWYEENGVIYNISGDEILYVNDEIENLYISEKIKYINPTAIIWNDLLKTIDVSPNNKTYFSCDNVLYVSGENEKVYLHGYVPISKAEKEIVIPGNIYTNEISFFSMHDIVLMIPNTVNYKVDFTDMGGGHVMEYKVQSGNTYYETYEGSLYTKGLKKMLVAKVPNPEKQILLPAQVEDFDEECLISIIKMIHWIDNPKEVVIDENNPNFIIEDGWLYTKNKTKLIMPIIQKKALPITNEPLEISKGLAKYFYDVENDEYESCYIYKGSLYTEGLKTMLKASPQ